MYSAEARRAAARLNITCKRRLRERPEKRILEIAYEGMWHKPIPQAEYAGLCAICDRRVSEHPDRKAFKEREA